MQNVQALRGAGDRNVEITARSTGASHHSVGLEEYDDVKLQTLRLSHRQYRNCPVESLKPHAYERRTNRLGK